jgi:single-strand DNA-binding protein
MADVNHVVIIGRLTRDAELKYTAAGFAISNFSVAVNRRRKNGDQWVEEANYFDVNLFGKAAESLKPYLVKGKQIAVEGELKQDRWEQDGQARSKVVISAGNIQLLGGGQGAGNSGGSSYAPQQFSSGGYQQNAGGYQQGAGAGYQQNRGFGNPPPQQQQPQKFDGYSEEEFEDDVPF